LIFASVFFVARNVKWNRKTISAFIICAIVAFFLTSPGNAPLSTDPSYWFIFLCGAIALCVMILLAVSGSFMLLSLGQYYFVLEALKNLNFTIIFIFAAGAIL